MLRTDRHNHHVSELAACNIIFTTYRHFGRFGLCGDKFFLVVDQLRLQLQLARRRRLGVFFRFKFLSHIGFMLTNELGSSKKKKKITNSASCSCRILSILSACLENSASYTTIGNNVVSASNKTQNHWACLLCRPATSRVTHAGRPRGYSIATNKRIR